MMNTLFWIQREFIVTMLNSFYKIIYFSIYLCIYVQWQEKIIGERDEVVKSLQNQLEQQTKSMEQMKEAMTASQGQGEGDGEVKDEVQVGQGHTAF